jgi:NADH-ubiquinone oxidoreductase chain 4
MLTALIVAPLVGALSISTMSAASQAGQTAIKRRALVTTVAVFALSVVMWLQFDASSSAYQFTVEYSQLSALHMAFGVDGLSLYFVLLTTFTMPIAVLASWQNVSHNLKAYMIALLVLQSFLTAVFLVLDLLLFYVFFEAVLIPLFVLVGVWGASEDRIRAAFLLFLYTLCGSLFMLLAFLVMFALVGSTDLKVLALADLSFETQQWLWLAIFLSLAVKTPLLPVHIWLSRAHVQASVAVSMILAGLVLKLATYGYVRVLIPLLPEASSYYGPLVQTVCVVTLVYSSLTTLRQTDFKVLVAYSSVAHMAVVVIGLFSNTVQGIEGAIMLGLGHGFVSPALFYCLGGVLYDRYHTRQLRYYRGLAQHMPVFSVLLFLFVLGNMSTPLTAN